MKALKKSEVRLLVTVVIVGFLFGFSQLKKKNERNLAVIKSEVSTARDNLRKMRDILVIPAPVKNNPSHSNEVTMNLLKDLTLPSELEGIEIVSVDRSSPTQFQVTTVGRFSHVMKFLSYLERWGGDFVVDTVNFKKVDGLPKNSKLQSGSGMVREIKGTFSISRKG